MTIRLVSSDGQAFDVPEKTIAAASGTIKAMLGEGRRAAVVVPLPSVTADTLSRVLNYVDKHYSAGGPDIADSSSRFLPRAGRPLARFDADFIRVDDDTLFDLIIAADVLQIKELLDLTCEAVADEMRGRTVEQIRERFNICNDYTEEEEEDVRRENSWAFEGRTR